MAETVMIEVKEGDWVVLKDYRHSVVTVTKVTPQTITYKDDDRRRRETKILRHKVLFAGAKPVCELLSAQLTSSEALAHQEQRAALDRRMKRDADLIAKANKGEL